MAVVVASGTALSTGATTKTADLITGQYQFGGKGVYTVIAKGSATGMNISFSVGGVALVNDLAIPFTGTAGTISVRDNVIASQLMNGGRVEMFLRNTSGGAVTTDYQVWFEPSR